MRVPLRDPLERVAPAHGVAQPVRVRQGQHLAGHHEVCVPDRVPAQHRVDGQAGLLRDARHRVARLDRVRGGAEGFQGLRPGQLAGRHLGLLGQHEAHHLQVGRVGDREVDLGRPPGEPERSRAREDEERGQHERRGKQDRERPRTERPGARPDGTHEQARDGREEPAEHPRAASMGYRQSGPRSADDFRRDGPTGIPRMRVPGAGPHAERDPLATPDVLALERCDHKGSGTHIDNPEPSDYHSRPGGDRSDGRARRHAARQEEAHRHPLPARARGDRPRGPAGLPDDRPPRPGAGSSPSCSPRSNVGRSSTGADAFSPSPPVTRTCPRGHPASPTPGARRDCWGPSSAGTPPSCRTDGAGTPATRSSSDA